MTKVNREVEERIKESFKKGYIKGVLDKEWGQTTADEEIEKVKAQTRNDLLRELLEEMPKKEREDDGDLEFEEKSSYERGLIRGRNINIDKVNTILQSKL